METILDYDVIVVGAGPGGSQCACTLAERGIKTLLIDKKTSGWAKPCGGGVSNRTFDEFGVPLSVGYQTKGIKFIVSGKVKSTSIKYLDVHRNSFDEWLAKRAVEKGATMFFGTSVTDIREQDGWYIVETSKGSFRSKFLVGADGVYSVIRKKVFSQDLDKRLLAFAIDYLYQGPHKIRTLDFYTDDDLPFGYGYIFPKDENNIIIGIAGLDIQNPKEVTEKFIQKYKDQIEGLKYVGFKGAHIPYRHLSEIRKGNCLLVGDAAGLNTPIAFAGIPIALKSGRRAGTLIADSIKAGEKALEKYTIESLRKESTSFAVCHDYWDYLVENKKQPSVLAIGKRYMANPKKFAAAMVYARWLGVLTSRMPFEQLGKFKV